MSICIPQNYIDAVKEVVSNPSSKDRLSKLKDIFNGDEKLAREINLLYEKSLLLKKQSTAFDKFIDNINGQTVKNRAKLKESFLKNQERKNAIISDSGLDEISREIFDRKYKLDLPDEAIVELAKANKKTRELKPLMEKTPSDSPERIAWAEEHVKIQEILDGVINVNNDKGFLATIGAQAGDAWNRIKSKETLLNKAVETLKTAKDIALAPVYKSIGASVDASFMFRQGRNLLVEDPKIWAKTVQEAFKPIKNITSKTQQDLILREFKIKLASSKLYQEALDSGLGVGVIEEFFPTSLAEKIPVIGNTFKASDISFTMFAQGGRMSLFEKLYKNTADNLGVTKLEPQLAKDIATRINSASGRGNLGRFENQSGFLNKVFYSARWIKSQTDVFTMPFNGNLDPIVQRQAQIQSAKIISSVGATMFFASMFTDVESDPRSSKFGKAKIPGSKDLWVDLTGGLGSYIVLATKSTLALAKSAGLTDMKASKSAISGKLTDINSGKFGSDTVFDLFVNFGAGKTAPSLSALIQYFRGQDYSGNKPTVAGTVSNLITPISPKNFYESLQDEDFVSALIGWVADSTGLSTANYGKYKK